MNAPHAERIPESTLTRREPFFWRMVDKTETCWLWTGHLNHEGYGLARVGGVNGGTHRHAWRMLRGPIPPGLTIDHLCRVRRCVNPDHMELVSMRENTLRGVGPSARNAVKTECAHGHPFDEENTQVALERGRLRRNCRACGRARTARFSARKKGKVTAGVPESTLSRADWERVASTLEAKAAELAATDPEIADIYRRDAARIRAEGRNDA
jgi:hypothetical protein